MFFGHVQFIDVLELATMCKSEGSFAIFLLWASLSVERCNGEDVWCVTFGCIWDLPGCMDRLWTILHCTFGLAGPASLTYIICMYIYYIMCFSLSNAAVIDKMSNAATTIPPSCLLIPIQHTSSAPWLTRSHRASDGKPSWLVSAGLPGSAWSRWYQATKTDFEQESKNAINAILVFR